MFMGIIQRICSLKKSKHFSITKHSKELEKIGIRNQQFEYDIAIKTWQKIYTDSSLTKGDKISLLQSIILSIKLALKYDYLASAIYSRKDLIGGLRCELIPEYFIDDKGNKQSVIYKEMKKEVFLEKDIVLVRPWNYKRYLKHKNRTTPFKYDKLNHKGKYYSRMDITLIYQGLHSITDGMLNRKEGELLVDIVNTDPIFKFVYTDGAYWYNEYDDSVISIVLDFRIAVLFKYIKELEKLKLSYK